MRDRDTLILEDLYDGITIKESTDEDYMTLAREPEKNKKNLEKIVYSAAKHSGYTQEGCHITDDKFSKFSIDKFGKHDFGYFGKGFYFGCGWWDKDNAKKRALWHPSKLEGNYIMYVFIKLDNPLIEFAGQRSLGGKLPEEYDGAIIRDPYTGSYSEIMVKDAYKIKSSDIVTYNDQNIIIPISQRFDSTKEDIRY